MIQFLAVVAVHNPCTWTGWPKKSHLWGRHVYLPAGSTLRWVIRWLWAIFSIFLYELILFWHDFHFCCSSSLRTTKLGLLVILQGNHLALAKYEAPQWPPLGMIVYLLYSNSALLPERHPLHYHSACMLNLLKLAIAVFYCSSSVIRSISFSPILVWRL